MFFLTRFKKVVYVMPAIALALSFVVFITAPKNPVHQSVGIGFNPLALASGAMGILGGSTLAPEPLARPNVSDKPYSSQSYEEKLATEKTLRLPDPLWSSFKASDKTHRGIEFQKSRCTNAAVIEPRADFFSDYQETIWRARDHGLKIHAFFVSGNGQVPDQFNKLKELEIPEGYGVITQTSAGMTFPPDRAESAQYFLSQVAAAKIAPNPVGMFLVVIEPPIGGCK